MSHTNDIYHHQQHNNNDIINNDDELIRLSLHSLQSNHIIQPRSVSSNYHNNNYNHQYSDDYNLIIQPIDVTHNDNNSTIITNNEPKTYNQRIKIIFISILRILFLLYILRCTALTLQQ